MKKYLLDMRLVLVYDKTNNILNRQDARKCLNYQKNK